MTRRIASVAIAPPTSICPFISDYGDGHADVTDGRRPSWSHQRWRARRLRCHRNQDRGLMPPAKSSDFQSLRRIDPPRFKLSFNAHLGGARECRHARRPQAAKSFRIRLVGFRLAWNVVWNGRCFGRGVFSTLRLQALLRPVRLHLCKARSFRLPALRTTGKLLSAACLLHNRFSPRAYHGALSAVNGCTPVTASIQLPQTIADAPKAVCVAT
jgi:hypothetical protein